MEEDKAIKIRQVKYRNNIVAQDHLFIKKRTCSMLEFKSFYSAAVTITGIENIRMIQKGQVQECDVANSTFQNFCELIV